jgi:hypothetical protein
VTVEADIKTVLATCCDRVFPDFAPFNTTRPFVCYQQIGGLVLNPLDRSLSNKQIGDFQVTVTATSRASAASVIASIEAAMRAAAQFVAKPISAPRSDFDAEVKVFEALQDFRVISNR